QARPLTGWPMSSWKKHKSLNIRSAESSFDVTTTHGRARSGVTWWVVFNRVSAQAAVEPWAPNKQRRACSWPSAERSAPSQDGAGVLTSDTHQFSVERMR